MLAVNVNIPFSHWDALGQHLRLAAGQRQLQHV
ncbi:Uncharacterised protein [Kluyvera cryocrescens]|uniref:Uncharacterized protein n=1 Tax=Kluyvera cryocrescens TaxID=580 RepID=A0A485CP55_KLUCR|nr:Uncharacterised protein [Kluyvera cryocrescens]